jgi:hypothetical protein
VCSPLPPLRPADQLTGLTPERPGQRVQGGEVHPSGRVVVDGVDSGSAYSCPFRKPSNARRGGLGLHHFPQAKGGGHTRKIGVYRTPPHNKIKRCTACLAREAEWKASRKRH